MKGILTAAAGVLFLTLLSQGFAAEKALDELEWRLIHTDAKGNHLYAAPVAKDDSGEGNLTVWMKFETGAANSPSPMLFLNELDCSKGLIKRLEVQLFEPTCAPDDVPVQIMSFKGKWDRPSDGIEKRLQEAVCRQDALKSL